MKAMSIATTARGLAVLISIVITTPMMASGQGEGEAGSQKTETSRGGYDLDGFDEQARKWGLTPAEAVALQKQVDKVVAETGGTQIAINKVLSRDGSSTITIPLPGNRTDQDAPYVLGQRAPLSRGESLPPSVQGSSRCSDPSAQAETDSGSAQVIPQRSTMIITLNHTASAAALASPPPSTSPAPLERVFLRPGQGTPCADGCSCALVRYGSGAYVFKFYHYGGYWLSYWYGSGDVLNNQTGGAATRLDNVNGRQLRCVPPGPRQVPVNWDPIWRIRLTESRC